MKEEYKVGIYLRLSREDERLGESSSISTQRDLLLNYIKDNKLTLIDEYIDDGVSGTTFNRKGFNRMLKDCENKKINMIITKDTSRLGRDHIEFGYYVEKYFPEHNIRYVAVNDGIDTFNKNNIANDMLLFKSAFNDMYVKDISNKLKSSLYTKKRNGQFVGCYAPYGYIKSNIDKHKLEIDIESSQIVKRIFKMFINGISISKICEILTNENIPTPSIQKKMNLGQKNIHYGVWSQRTVSDILKNPTYIGNLTQNKQKKINYKSKKRIHNKEEDWIISENSTEPIIDEYTFNLAKNIFNSNKNRTNKGNNITNNLLLRGLIYCKDCHHTIGFRISNNNIYGNCNYWIKRKKQNVCTPHSVKYNTIEKFVLNNIKELIKNNITKEDINKILNKLNNSNNKQNLMNEIKKINNNINNINKKIDICYNDKLEGNITLDIYKRTYNNLSKEIENNIIKKEKLEKELLKNNNNDYKEKIKDILNLNNINRTLISSLIDKIEIDNENNIYIYYKFNILKNYAYLSESQ